MCVRSDAVLARGLLGIAALLVIGCVDTERDVPVEFEIEGWDGELLADTVFEVRSTWLTPRPCLYEVDCETPDEYGMRVNGRITARICDSLSARATDRRTGGTHHVTLNVRIIPSALEACTKDASFLYDATIEVRGNRSPSAVSTWILNVYHDGFPVPPYN